MAIRRTREDKERAQLRREQVGYTWKPEASGGGKITVPVVKTPIKTASMPSRADQAERLFFFKDIRRTFYALAIVGLLLLLAWFKLR